MKKLFGIILSICINIIIVNTSYAGIGVLKYNWDADIDRKGVYLGIGGGLCMGRIENTSDSHNIEVEELKDNSYAMSATSLDVKLGYGFRNDIIVYAMYDRLSINNDLNFNIQLYGVGVNLYFRDYKTSPYITLGIGESDLSNNDYTMKGIGYKCGIGTELNKVISIEANVYYMTFTHETNDDYEVSSTNTTLTIHINFF